MNDIIMYQAGSCNVYATKEEALIDDEESDILRDLDNLVGLDHKDSFIVARYIREHFTKKESSK